MIYEKTLENGLELIIKKTNAPVAAFQVWVDVGSIDEKPEEAGFCHFLEHMLFKGTKKRTTSQIAKQVEGSGGDMNAFTSFEHTVYHITGSNTRWDISNDILFDMVNCSIFKKTEFDPEKEVILEEIKRGNDSPDRQLYYDVYESMYGKSGYGKPVIGFPRTVSKCSEKTLKAFWEKWYSPALMTVVIVGDVDIKAVEARVEKTWGTVKRKPLRVRRRITGFKSPIKTTTNFQISRNFDVNSIRWSGAIPSCSIFADDLPALDVASMILGFGETSRLYQRLFREEKSVTGVSASNWSPLGTGMLNFDVESSIEKMSQFRKGLWEEVSRFCKDGPTKEELERTKILLETDRIYNAQSMEDIANRYGHLKTSVGNANYDLEYTADIRELSAEDIRDVTAKYFNSSQLRECVLLPKNIQGKDFWKQANHHYSLKPIETSSDKKIHKKLIANTNIISEKCSNGIELLMIPRNDVPVVAMQSTFAGGLRFENRKNSGITNLLAEAWEKGPKNMTAEQFSAFLENRASRIDTFSGRNSVGLTATTTTHFLDDLLPVYIDTLMNAALVEKEIAHAKELQLEDIKTIEDNPGRLCSKIFNETLFQDCPYAFPIIGYEDSVKNISATDVKNLYANNVLNSKCVVSVVGKFNPSAVQKHFESIKRNSIQNKIQHISFQAPKAPRYAEIKKNREQSHVIVGYTGLKVTDPRRFTMKVLMTILSGQSGRLFREIRDKQGLCYTVAPIAFEGVETGYFGIYIGTDPLKREKAILSIHHELKKMCIKPVPKEEITRAKEFLLGRHHMDMQLNSTICSAIGFSSLYGMPSEELFTWNESLKKIDAKAIQKLSQEIFEQPAITAVVV